MENKISFLVSLLGFLGTVLLFPLVFFIFDDGWYVEEFDQLGLPAKSLKFTHELMDYFLSFEQLTTSEELTIKEKMHLSDVKTIIHISFAVLALCLSVSVVSFFLFDIESLIRTLQYSGLISLVLVGLIAILPFEPAFELFHSFFFVEGSWQFPKTSVLLLHYPLQFWQDAAFRWLALVGGMSGIILVSTFIFYPKRKYSR